MAPHLSPVLSMTLYNIFVSSVFLDMEPTVRFRVLIDHEVKNLHSIVAYPQLWMNWLQPSNNNLPSPQKSVFSTMMKSLMTFSP